MSIKLMSAVWDADLTPTKKLVLLALADQANDDGLCWPSVGTIEKRTGLAERGVQIALAELEEANHLKRKFRSGHSTYYYIHPRTTCTPHEMPPAPRAPTPALDAPPPPHHVHPESSFEPSLTKVSVATKPKRGTRLPDDWEPNAANLKFVREVAPDLIAEDIELRFRDYWHSTPGAKGVKLDWDATWRNWVRAEADRFYAPKGKR